MSTRTRPQTRSDRRSVTFALAMPRRFGTRLACVLLVIGVVAYAAEAGTCTFQPDASSKIEVKTDFSQFTLQGGGMRARPFSVSQSNTGALFVDFWAYRVCETYKSRDVDAGRGCIPPGFPKFENDTEGTNTVRCLSLLQCDCATIAGSNNPQPGIHEQTWAVNVDCSQVSPPLYQDFSLVLTFRLPDAPYNTSFPPTETSRFTTLTNEKQPNRLALSIDMAGWPWHPNYTGSNAAINNTYVFVEFLMQPGPFGSEVINMSGIANPKGSYIVLETEDVKNEFFFDLGYLIDDEPYAPRAATFAVSTQQLSNPFPDDPNFRLIPLPLRKQFCTEIEYLNLTYTTVVKWNNVSYDPYFSSIFTGSTEIDAPVTPARKHSNKVAIAASLGTIGGLIVVVAIVAVLATTVPSFRAFFRPFSQRGEKSASSSIPEKREPSWSAGKKPKPE